MSLLTSYLKSFSFYEGVVFGGTLLRFRHEIGVFVSLVHLFVYICLWAHILDGRHVEAQGSNSGYQQAPLPSE